MFSRNRTPAKLRTPAFAGLPSWELGRLDQLGTAIEVKAGNTIISRGSAGREAFVVLDGDFTVEGDSVSTVIGQGDVAGELALLTGQLRSASVTASTDALVYALDPREFASLLHEAPAFRERIIETAASRLENEAGSGISDKSLAPHFRTYFR